MAARRKSRRVPPSVDLPEVIEAAMPYITMSLKQTDEREKRRLDVFERAFAQVKTTEHKVALAVAYLGK